MTGVGRLFADDTCIGNTAHNEENVHTLIHKDNKKITEHRASLQRERQNSYVNKQTKSVNNRKTKKTAVQT